MGTGRAVHLAYGARRLSPGRTAPTAPGNGFDARGPAGGHGFGQGQSQRIDGMR